MSYDLDAERTRNVEAEAASIRWKARFEAENPYAKLAREMVDSVVGDPAEPPCAGVGAYLAGANALATIAVAYERWRATD